MTSKAGFPSAFRRGLTVLAAAAAIGAAAPSAVPPSQAAASGVTHDGYLKAGFDLLGAFELKVPNEDGSFPAPAALKEVMAGIPSGVRKLDGQRVIVTGYMLPLKMNGSRVTEFLLVSSPMLCCYGMTPRLNDWVVVKMPDTGTSILMDSPIQFYGRLHVQAINADGMLGGIYRLDGEKMGDGLD